ncbi:cytochrome c oxidase assembly factor Coa1 family protein [Acidobacteriota bacterium]
MKKKKKGCFGISWFIAIPLGCLGTVVLVIVCAVGFVFFGMGKMYRSSGAYQDGLSLAQTHPEVTEALGSPVKAGFFTSGSVSMGTHSNSADLKIPISGPKGKGTLFVTAAMSDSVWKYSKLEVIVPGVPRIDMLDSVSDRIALVPVAPRLEETPGALSPEAPEQAAPLHQESRAIPPAPEREAPAAFGQEVSPPPGREAPVASERAAPVAPDTKTPARTAPQPFRTSGKTYDLLKLLKFMVVMVLALIMVAVLVYYRRAARKTPRLQQGPTLDNFEFDTRPANQVVSPAQTMQDARSIVVIGFVSFGMCVIGLFNEFLFSLGIFGLIFSAIIFAIFRHLKRIDKRLISHATALTRAMRERQVTVDPDQFVTRVTSGFIALQRAWEQQELKGVRHLVSDALHESFLWRIDLQKRLGYHDVIVKASRVRIQPWEYYRRGPFESLTVAITSPLVTRDRRYRSDVPRTDVDDRAQKIINIDFQSSKPFRMTRAGQSGREVMRGSAISECWTFVRRRTTQTRAEGLLERKCPGCGAGLEMAQTADCSHCGAHLLSGEHDWVLTEITQLEEFQAREAAVPPGFAQLKNQDAEITQQHIEDRAAVLFQRLRAAERARDASLLAGVARAVHRDSLLQNKSNRLFLADIKVHHVDVAAVRCGTERNLALVEVLWSATVYVKEKEKLTRRKGANWSIRSWLLLERSSSARSRLDHALLSAHCSACGAPHAAGDGGVCAFCGIALEDGSQGWLLVGEQQGSYEAASPYVVGAIEQVVGVEQDQEPEYRDESEFRPPAPDQTRDPAGLLDQWAKSLPGWQDAPAVEAGLPAAETGAPAVEQHDMPFPAPPRMAKPR